MEEMELKKCALIYDFDGTLAEGNCAEHGLMDALGIKDVGEFWERANTRAKSDDGDGILAYMAELLDCQKQSNSDALDADKLREYGAKIPLFNGVEDWFYRINSLGETLGLQIDHYIISSGLDEMIRGTVIGSQFEQVFACKFHYENGETNPTYPSLAINYTTKTQYLFRINKGIHNSWDNEAVNMFIEMHERDMPFERMIYFGDGDTDIPSMKMVRMLGGFSLAVFDPDKWNDAGKKKSISKLISEERANYVVPADYREGGLLDVTVQGLLELFARRKI